MISTIIGIAGGTASGKTTVARKIYQMSQSLGSVVVIKLDDYYNENSHLTIEQRRIINYDHPSSYDSQLLIKHLKRLRSGQSIDKPTYDFVEHNRAKATERIDPADVIIVEGIMIFAIPELRKLFDIKLYVHTPDDVRFIRRLTRDINERGRSVDSVINQYLTTVRPMHLEYVEPSRVYADLIIPEGGQNEVAIDIIATKIADIMHQKNQHH
ncbi:MAG TPA: uridine kinase [Acholeplasmatales bacterium]|nr:uridine kinase [Acholeplasmatales bacterium]